MRKLLILITLVVSISVSIHSCDNDSKVANLDDDLQTVMTSVDSVVTINSAATFTIDIKKNSSKTWNFAYQQRSGSGILYYDTMQITEKRTITGKEKKLQFRYIPTSQGEHRLSFTFSNDETSINQQFICKADKMYFTASAELDGIHTDNLPLGKEIVFYLNLTKTKDSCNAKQFKTIVTIAKGAGEVFINDVRSYSTLSETRAGTQTYLTPGKNKVTYIPAQTGTNIIQFDVFNSYGISQRFSVPLDIKAPTFMLSHQNDSVSYLNTPIRLPFTIKSGQTEEAYTFTYTTIKNSGTLKVNNTILQPSSPLSLVNGNHLIEFVPAALGEGALEFIVKDKYNTVKKDTAIFKVVKATTQITIANYDSIATLYDTKSFNFSLNKKNYKGGYKFEIVTVPAGAATLKVNGSDYTGGKVSATNPDNTLVSLVPILSEKIKLDLKVYDDYGNETVRALTFNIKNSNGKIIVSNHSAECKLLTPTNFNFAIQKKNYTGKYQLEIISNLSGCGKLKINSAAYVGGKIAVNNIENTLVTFTPEKTGEMKLTLKATDEAGEEIIKDVLFSVSNTDITISVKNVTPDLILGTATTFSFTASKPNYTSKLNYEIIQEPAGSGTLKINGESYIPGLENILQRPLIENNASTAVSFLPAKAGNVKLTIIITDNLGGEAKYPILFTATSPGSEVSIADFNPTGIINIENCLKFSVDKSNYTGKFKYSVTTVPEKAGKIKVNDLVHYGGKTDLLSKENNKFCFTPTVSGDVKIVLKIYDDYGNEAEQILNFNIEIPTGNIIISNHSAECKLLTPTNFNFAIQKKNYTGKYQLEIISDPSGCGKLKINSAAYVGGKIAVNNIENTLVTFTPEKIGEVKLTLKVTDEAGEEIIKDVLFSVSNTDITISVKDVTPDLILGTATTFSFTASKPNYTGKLNYEIIQEPAGSGTLKINGESYIPGLENILQRPLIENNASMVASFLPAKAGSVKLTIKVGDDFGGEKPYPIVFNVTDQPTDISISDFVPNGIINTESCLKFSLNKPNYTGKFQYSIATTPLVAGTVKINDANYAGGKIDLLSKENNKLCFTPTVSGDVKIDLKVYDDFGGEEKRELNYNIINPPLELSFSPIPESLTVNKPASFFFSSNKKDYKGKYFCEVTSDNCKDIKINNSLNGKVEILPEKTIIYFTPVKEGEAKLSVKVTDEWGGSASKDISCPVLKAPDVKMSFSGIEQERLKFSQYTSFTFSASEENYTGKYTCNIKLKKGKIDNFELNNSWAYTLGTDQLLYTSTNVPIKFRPTSEDDIVLEITVKDATGNSKTEELTFKVAPVEIRQIPVKVCMSRESGDHDYSKLHRLSGYDCGGLEIAWGLTTYNSGYRPSSASTCISTHPNLIFTAGSTETSTCIDYGMIPIPVWEPKERGDYIRLDYSPHFIVETEKNCLYKLELTYRDGSVKEADFLWLTGISILTPDHGTPGMITEVNDYKPVEWTGLKISFNIINSPDIFLSTNTPSHFSGGAKGFFVKFDAKKNFYKGKLYCEIIPGENVASIKIGRDNYTGKVELRDGEISVSALHSGEASITIRISDEQGNSTSKVIKYDIQ